MKTKSWSCFFFLTIILFDCLGFFYLTKRLGIKLKRKILLVRLFIWNAVSFTFTKNYHSINRSFSRDVSKLLINFMVCIKLWHVSKCRISPHLSSTEERATQLDEYKNNKTCWFAAKVNFQRWRPHWISLALQVEDEVSLHALPRSMHISQCFVSVVQKLCLDCNILR